MLNFLVETKQEYTIQLINVLTPLIYEGLQSIYLEVLKVSNSDNILKNFQTFMQRIPKWNNDIIHNESQRIMNNSKSYSWLGDLIKATLKSNIIVLTYNPTVKQQIKIDSSLYQNINIDDFIHKIYIECARDLWNNPYLFYHQYSPIELKRNQRDSILLIKDCIREAIRKLLPVKHMLTIYLGEDMEQELLENNFEKSISEIESRNLNKLIKKDLYQDQNKSDILDYNSQNNFNPDDLDDFNDLEKLNDDDDNLYNNNKNNKNKETDENSISLNNNTNTIGSQILNIINNNDMKLTENMTSENNEIINNNDEKMNKIINNLDISETSISNNKNDKFQEVFSNSTIKNNNKPLLNNNDKKNNFASYYLNNLNL